MNFKLRCLLLFVFLVMSVGLAEAAVGVQIEMGSYKLKGDRVSGVIDLVKGKNGYRAMVDITADSAPHSMASFEGTALIQGNKLIINSTEGDNAQLVVTFLNAKKLVIKANEEAIGYTGASCGFDGDYTYTVAKNTVKKSNMPVAADELKRMSIFLSNFTEVGFYEISDVANLSLDELVYFGVRHNCINNKKLIKQERNGMQSIDGKSVVESVKKYFALDIKPLDLDSASYSGKDYDYDGKEYQFLSDTGKDKVYYAQVIGVYKDGNKIRMEGKIYNIKNSKDVLGSFSAYAKPWKYGGKDTWALLSMTKN